MYIILQRFFQYKREVRRLSAVAVGVFTVVIILDNGFVEPFLSLLDLRTDLWQISKLKWSAVLLNDVHHRHIIEMQLIINNLKLFSREVEGLVNQVKVLIHLSVMVLFGSKNSFERGRNIASK